MNSKLIKGSLAGVAVVALAAGSTTFAAWSDWDSLTGSQSGADQLTLVLGEPNSRNFDDLKLAPGERGDFEFVVASREGETVTAADLRVQLTNLVGTEDGCTSTNSEAAVDPNCNDMTSEGEFIDQARIIVNASQPTTDLANACSDPRGSRQGPISLRALRDNSAASPVNLLDPGVTLGPGEGICVAMGINLPASADNATQGDSASFDLKFLLDQVI